MSRPAETRRNKSRQACEPCRRKKTKCPAERPTCSICQRLNQQCTYLPRHRQLDGASPTGVSKTSAQSSARVERLQSQIDSIYGILQSISENDASKSQPTATPSQKATIPLQSGEVVAEALTQGTTAPSTQTYATSDILGLSSNSDSSTDMLTRCIRAYKDKIHAQPMPLFRVSGLKARLAKSPEYLFWIFIALTQNFCRDSINDELELGTVELHLQSARQLVIEKANEGEATIDIVLSLCMLAMLEIITCKPARAWMLIGTTIRAETLRRINRDNSIGREDDHDSDCRCYWSVFLLERTFSCRTSYTPKTGAASNHPASPLPPPLIRAIGFDDTAAGFLETDQIGEDGGINAPCMKAVSIWSEVISYCHEIRSGRDESAWSPNSTHHRLMNKVYEWDSEISENHLLRNISFTRRSAADISEHREYWSAWTLMQIAMHGSQAILNHPFIHLIVLRDHSLHPQSRVFQQQTVDQALYHSGWVARLVRSCNEVQYEVNDPLIGSIVAATATVPWLFQFARDEKVAKRARLDFRTCEQLLDRLSSTWPQFATKLQTLRELQSLAEYRRNNIVASSSILTFQPALVWDLLNPDISHMIYTDAVRNGTVSSTIRSPDAVIRIATKFIHPLPDDSSEQPAVYQNAETVPQTVQTTSDMVDDISLDDFLFQLDPDDFSWLQPEI